jgi:hypothetical protein
MGHGENVPSDWYSSRYRCRCDICGRSYHASDGGCDCAADLDDCACGRNEWGRKHLPFCSPDPESPIICEACGTEPGTEPEPEGVADDE